MKRARRFGFVSGRSVVSALILLGVAAAVFGQSKRAADSWLLSATDPASAISASTTRASLATRFGKENVVDADVYLGEGESEPGTVLFPNDPARKLEILWKNAEHNGPKSVRLTGDESRWHTVSGISLGTTLQELERINRKPFTLAGFGWDYGGTVVSWRAGDLAKDFDKPRVIIRLAPGNRDAVTPKEHRAVSGDRDFSSGHPVLQKMNPRIHQIVMEFP